MIDTKGKNTLAVVITVFVTSFVITLGLLVIYRKEIWHWLNPPHVTITSISYKINKASPVVATPGEIIALNTNTELCLVDLEYSSPGHRGPQDLVHGEAYIRKGGQTEQDIDYKDGRFTKISTIEQGTQELGDFKLGPNKELNPCWVIKSGWNTVIVVLVHYYPYGNAVDDRFFLTLGIE